MNTGRLHREQRPAALPGSTLRVLASSGLVEGQLPTFREAANDYRDALMGRIPGDQFVVWVDNWYLRRPGTNVGGVDPAFNCSVMTLLDFSGFGQPLTRSHRIPDSYRALAGRQLVGGVDEAAHQLVFGVGKLVAGMQRCSALQSCCSPLGAPVTDTAEGWG